MINFEKWELTKKKMMSLICQHYSKVKESIQIPQKKSRRFQALGDQEDKADDVARESFVTAAPSFLSIDILKGLTASALIVQNDGTGCQAFQYRFLLRPETSYS